ncbi:MAG TPA: TetR/AcrR family transcriptional regulator [Solirubrobacterales bacterium]|nr:TetR/AcrR family transcriptional regulator [Solirubrobacterales bacterium]
MGTAILSRAELVTYQRERVILNATPVFAKRGYQATTVDDLLATGKVGAGNFYSLFDGKEDCFLACFDHASAEALETISSSTQDAVDWDQAAYLGLAAMLEFFCAEPLVARIVLVEAQSAGAAAVARHNALLDRAVAWLSSGRRAHPEASALPPTFEQASVAGFSFYLQQCLLDAHRPPASQLLSETAGIMLAPIIGDDRLALLAREQESATAAP